MFIYSKSFHQLTSRGAQKKLFFLQLNSCCFSWFSTLQRPTLCWCLQGNCIEKADSFAWGLLRFFFLALFTFRESFSFIHVLVVVRKAGCQPLHTKPYSTLIQINGPEYTQQSFCLSFQMSQLSLALIQNKGGRSTVELLVSPSFLVDPHTMLSKAKMSTGHRSHQRHCVSPPSIRV